MNQSTLLRSSFRRLKTLVQSCHPELLKRNVQCGTVESEWGPCSGCDLVVALATVDGVVTVVCEAETWSQDGKGLAVAVVWAKMTKEISQLVKNPAEDHKYANMYNTSYVTQMLQLSKTRCIC